MPGIAVARELVRRNSKTQILFVGAEQGIEATVVPREGFALETLRVGGLKRVGWFRTWVNAVAMAAALIRSWGLLARFDPDVVVGLGGYASFPAVGAAILRRVPRVIMEQNILPGLANKVLGMRADFVAVPDERAARHFPGRAVVTGNPVRKAFKAIPRKDHQPPFTVLVTGGSQGAESINGAVMDALTYLSERKTMLRFLHQSGHRQEPAVRNRYEEAGFDAEVRSFFEGFERCYEDADLIISRAGNTSVAEIQAAGRASILIPLPFAADDHQRRNARAMADASAAVVIDPTELNGERLAKEIVDLLDAPDRLRKIEENAREMAVTDAEARVADLIERAARRKP
jgi:UDP-N-acetylglucosamine--N-acetylmuramyl-(pentapeptide) pyrophosphoryl-undecaprenol N-acetylglucosamine transferase